MGIHLKYVAFQAPQFYENCNPQTVHTSTCAQISY